MTPVPLILHRWLAGADLETVVSQLEATSEPTLWRSPRTMSPCLDQPPLRDRLHLFKAIYPTIQPACQAISPLLAEPLTLLWDFWLHLALQLVEWRKGQPHPLIQGFLGGQGTGKTTLTLILGIILQHLGYRTISLSIDDFYKTYADRQQLQRQDPRLDRRGPPGTHDLALALAVLTAIKRGDSPLHIPRFDKSAWQGAGDRTTPETVAGADIVLLEGWLVGVRPIDPIAFDTAPPPIVTAADRRFARDMNERLRDYLPLWGLLDRLIVLHVPDYRISQQWRQQAEHQMIAQGKPGMSDAAIADFVEYFWRSLHPELFIQPLIHQPQWVDWVIEITPDHLPGRIYPPTADA